MSTKALLLALVVAAAGCGSVDPVMDADAATGAGGSPSPDGGAAGGASGSPFERPNDPACGIGIAACGGTSATPCADHRIACPGGTCLGTTCCLGCVDGNGKCVGGAEASDCGGSGYDCHVCTGSNFPHCTLDSDGIDHGCSASQASPILGEAGNAACASGSSKGPCTTAAGMAGACAGTLCCTGCVDAEGKCRTGDSASACGTKGAACVVEAMSDFTGCG